ncbi:MAG: hypothetical protein AVO39_09335 [delta proteobacterium MLS_D]|jgi:hypothetical protein|nr:MAG: hypothetical protein AVO39_09335 [delta proteobacterium MLS_D]
MKNVVTIRNETGDEAASVYSIKRVGDKLVMDGKALGTMRMEMILSADDAVRAVKMALSWQVVSYMLFVLPWYFIKRGFAKKSKREI